MTCEVSEDSDCERWRSHLAILRRLGKLEILFRMYTSTNHCYPLGCTEPHKRSIRRKAAKFAVRDGEHFFKKKKKNTREGKKVREREYCLIFKVVSDSAQHLIIQIYVIE